MSSCMEIVWLASVVVCLEAVLRHLPLGMETDLAGGWLTGENTDKWRKIQHTIRMIP